MDLPAPMSMSPIEDLPAPKGSGSSLDLDPFEDVPAAVDLPALKAEPAPRPSGFDPFADMDLPAPMEPSGAVDFPTPMDSGAGGGIDLPALKASGSGGGRADLPAPKGSRSFGDEVDLPMALTDTDLPAPISLDSELPTRRGQSDLPMPRDQQDLPTVRDDFSDPQIKGLDRVHGGGPIELDLPEEEDLSLEMDIDGPPPGMGQPGSGDRISRDSAEFDLPESENLEFSELPSTGDGVVHMPHPGGEGGAVAPAARRKRTIDIRAALSRKRPPWLMKAVAAIVGVSLILGAGFYMGSTKYGLFGIHLVEAFLPASGDAVQVAQTIQQAEAAFAADTYAVTTQALVQLERARNDARLNRALIARSLLHESYFQIRYGQEAESAARADELRLHLRRRGDEAPGIHLALAANALRQGDPALAASEIALAQNEDPTDAYVDHVAGEIALAAREGQSAVDAFGRAHQKDGSARAQWGLARGYRILGDRDKALAAAKETQRVSPNHAGARVAVAENLIAERDVDAAYELLRIPAGVAPGEGGATASVARADRSAALALVARIEEYGGRLGAAREMYEKAVELDASNAQAALGAARLVLFEGAYQDALARFQTVIGSNIDPSGELDPTGQPKVLVEAKLGAAEALVAMDKAGEAKTLMADLKTEEPVNADVEIWQGKIADSLGDSKEAVRHLRNAIALEPKAFRAYMALAQHYKGAKRPAEAVGVLVEAQQNVEITAEVRRLLGDAELERNHLDAAITQYQAALEMEPRDSSAQFGLAMAYRRKLALEEAAAALAKVEELDAKYPGLPLEKGRLAEASGDMVDAAASYQAALKETPTDATLQSRLGAVLTITGQLDEAETILRRVLETQAYSAEAEHYLGRIEMERGDLATARQHFRRAARLEPQKALYRMYVAWGALESNELTTALRDLDATLKLDPTLGDAYWLRARIRIRAGMVRDALADLQKAIELNPDRIEAWAAIGECHYQLGQMKEAIVAFQKAVEADPKQGYWWYRLGRLQLDETKRAQALQSLSAAVEIGDGMAERPPWLADTHRLMGDLYYAQRKRREAVVHYERYLELSTPDAIDRADVKSKLRKIGAVTR
ncbi:MAG: tetratricopeptide repeat protein [Deltaproteobacteria bacterium]|nr:tetratricopeptide repeat protein [Deltaproteobacteria bacterium]